MKFTYNFTIKTIHFYGNFIFTDNFIFTGNFTFTGDFINLQIT